MIFNFHRSAFVRVQKCRCWMWGKLCVRVRVCLCVCVCVFVCVTGQLPHGCARVDNAPMLRSAARTRTLIYLCTRQGQRRLRAHFLEIQTGHVACACSQTFCRSDASACVGPANGPRRLEAVVSDHAHGLRHICCVCV